MLTQKTEHVPVSTLKAYLPVDDVKKTAATQAEGITPFENGPFAIFENMLDKADHLRQGKLAEKVGANRLPSLKLRSTSHLVVDGMLGIEIGQLISRGTIEGLDPGGNDLTGGTRR